MSDDDDHALANMWRDVSRDTPDPLLDARILAAARAQQRRRHIAPLAAALAACLVLALYVSLSAGKPVTPHYAPVPGIETFGMQAGRELAILSDAGAMRQMLPHKPPGGPNPSDVVHP